jgi:ribosome biogenesis GTPase A
MLRGDVTNLDVKGKSHEYYPEKHEDLEKGHDYLVALAGNPNTGKSTVFNALTGLRARASSISTYFLYSNIFRKTFCP